MKKFMLLLSAACLTLCACEQTNIKKEVRDDRDNDQPKRTQEERKVSLADEDDDANSADSDEADNTNNSNQTENDRMLTQRIRQVLQNDNNLASPARNLDISTRNGTVTLSGKVNSEREKVLLVNKVRQLSGVNNINNQLEVASTASQTRGY
jgi:osmotically-inducible protein OsmY